MFIPPEGAIQFEITHPDTKFKGEHFWVMPLHDFTDVIIGYGWPKTCKCKSGFLAIPESISPRLRVIMSGTRHNCFCLCVGRIIE